MNDLMTKSFLSYVELRKQALKDLEAGPDLEIAVLSQRDEDNLAQFFEEVSIIKLEMEGITNLLQNLRNLHEEAKVTHSPKVLRGLRDQMDSDMVAILRKAKIIKARIEAMERSNIANRGISPAYKEGSSIDRTRISVTNGLRSKIREMMIEFQKLREQIVAEHKEGLKRRYFNATGQEASVETIEKMLSASGQVEIFKDKAELNSEIHERQQAVKQIQKSLTELQQLFLDMAVLVETQGEHMDDIENNVVRAGDYINDGAHHLVMAKEAKRKDQEWMCWICVLVALLIFLFLISILN